MKRKNQNLNFSPFFLLGLKVKKKLDSIRQAPVPFFVSLYSMCLCKGKKSCLRHLN